MDNETQLNGRNKQGNINNKNLLIIKSKIYKNRITPESE